MLVLAVFLVACADAGGGGAAPQAETEAEPTATPEEAAAEPTAAPEEEAAEAEEAPAEAAEAEVEGEALVIWADENRAPALETQVQKFQDQYGLGVEVQLVDFDDIRENFQVAGPAGEGPDIIVGAHDWLGELVASGLLAPVELGDKQADFLPAAVQGFTFDGELYGMPYAIENVALFRNPDLVPEAPATWSEVMEIAAQLEDEGAATLGYNLQVNDAYHFFPIQTAFGGYVFGLNEEGYDPTDVGIDSAGSIAAAEWLEMMVQEGHLQEDMDWDTMHALFENGEVGMFITGPWALERIRESGVPYAISSLPGETVESQPFLGVQGFMVSAFSEDPLLAQAFLTEFVATDEVMQAMFEADPRPSAYVPVRETIEDPDLAAFAEAGANGLPMPAIPEMGAVWGSWADAITLIFQDQLSGEEAFKNAGEQIRTAIEEGE
jgi:maltose-binding protein MalE